MTALTVTHTSQNTSSLNASSSLNLNWDKFIKCVPPGSDEEIAVAIQILKQESRSPAELAGFTNETPLCQILLDLNIEYFARLQIYHDNLKKSLDKEQLTINAVVNQATYSIINELTNRWFPKLTVFNSIPYATFKAASAIYKLKFYVLRNNDKLYLERYKWVLSTHAGEAIRLHDGLCRLKGRFAVITDDEYLNEMVESGCTTKDQLEEYRQLRAVQEAVYPNEEPVVAKYEALFTRSVQKVLKDKPENWKDRLKRIDTLANAIIPDKMPLKFEDKTILEHIL